jgi:hypothetical protein
MSFSDRPRSRARAAPARPSRWGRRTRHALIAVAALAIAIPGVAYAAVQLTSEDVAASMPAGTLALAGARRHPARDDRGQPV